MSELKLIIGNRNYSSWSLRAWLVMRLAGQDFTEEMIPLDLPDTRDRLRAASAAGRVPVLNNGGLVIWDTLSIIEYLAETYPDQGIWPTAPEDRALARSVSAEMHSSFFALRGEMPMNIRAVDRHLDLSEGAVNDIARVLEIWQTCLARDNKDGPFLFGNFCAADAMYAPVIARFQSYGVHMDATCQAYADVVWNTDDMIWWRAASAEESWTIPGEEVGI